MDFEDKEIGKMLARKVIQDENLEKFSIGEDNKYSRFQKKKLTNINMNNKIVREPLSAYRFNTKNQN